MVDTVASKVVFSGTRRHVVKLTNISDATGETDVVKVDVSTLVGPDGNPPTYTAIEEISWAIQGFSSVRLEWNATVDDIIMVLSAGEGYANFQNVGGLVDPKSAGFNGDIVLTTVGATLTSTYDITLVLRLKD